MTYFKWTPYANFFEILGNGNQNTIIGDGYISFVSEDTLVVKYNIKEGKGNNFQQKFEGLVNDKNYVIEKIRDQEL